MELREKKGDYKSNKDKKDRFEKLFGNEDFMKNVFTKKWWNGYFFGGFY